MIEKFKKNLPLIAVLLGVFAFVMMFCPAVCIDMEEIAGSEMSWQIEGTKAVFGMEMMENELFEFSFPGFLAYLLPLVGVVCVYLAHEKQNKILWIVAAVAFVVGAILLFLMPSLVAYAEKAMKKEIGDYLTLGAGSIIGAISCLLAAACLIPDLMKAMQPAAAPAPVVENENQTETKA